MKDEKVTCPVCQSEDIEHCIIASQPGINGKCNFCGSVFYDYRLAHFDYNPVFIANVIRRMDFLEEEIGRLRYELEEIKKHGGL